MIRMWYSSSVTNSYIYCWLLYRSAPIMHTCWIPNINNGLELWGRRVTFLNHLPAFLPTFSLKIFSCLLYIFFFISVFRNITGSHAGHVMCVFLLWREFDKVKVSGNEHIFFFFCVEMRFAGPRRTSREWSAFLIYLLTFSSRSTLCVMINSEA